MYSLGLVKEGEEALFLVMAGGGKIEVFDASGKGGLIAKAKVGGPSTAPLAQVIDGRLKETKKERKNNWLFVLAVFCTWQGRILLLPIRFLVFRCCGMLV